MDKIKKNLRLWCLIAFTAVSNGYVKGFATGKIYTGNSKIACLPGLNCYSCPGALGACPIGSLQATFGSRNFTMAFYVLGFLMMVGAVCGRFVCGWLCPFGLVQDLLHKIPGVKKIKTIPGDRILKGLKYVILGLFVVILPLFVVDFLGQSSPWFCKYICPSGSLYGGIPLVATNSPLWGAVGWLFAWKMWILVVLLVLSLFIWRPFCRWLCPLGAIYGFFNRFALYRFTLAEDKCVQCGACNKACKMNIDVLKHPNSMACIRCGDCLSACPTDALDSTYGQLKKRAMAKQKR